MKNKLFNVDQISDFIGISKSQCRILIAEGMPGIKIGVGSKRIASRFDVDEVVRWLRSRSQKRHSDSTRRKILEARRA